PTRHDTRRKDRYAGFAGLEDAMVRSRPTSSAWPRPTRPEAVPSRPAAHPPVPSDLGQRTHGRLDTVCNEPEETTRCATVTDAVVERQREWAQHPRGDLTAHDPRPLDDPSDPEYASLGVVDDRG